MFLLWQKENRNAEYAIHYCNESTNAHEMMVIIVLVFFKVTDCDLRETPTNFRSQIVTSSWGGNRKFPYDFTEQGVAMPGGV